MTQPTPFTPATPGRLELAGDHFAVTCATVCGAARRVPADVGLLTAECGLRSLGWSRVPDRRVRCPRCAAPPRRT